MSLFFDPTLQGLSQALTFHEQRHEVLASNLANVETPGYRAHELDFQSALKAAFDVEPNRTIDRPPVVEDPTGPRRADGNTVDVDLQMTKLNANGARYLALARILALRVGLLRTAIEGTR